MAVSDVVHTVHQKSQGFLISLIMNDCKNKEHHFKTNIMSIVISISLSKAHYATRALVFFKTPEVLHTRTKPSLEQGGPFQCLPASTATVRRCHPFTLEMVYSALVVVEVGAGCQSWDR